MATKKMTKKEMFMAIRDAIASDAFANDTVTNKDEMIDFINREIKLLERKSGGTRKPTATQIENEKLKAEIMAYLTEVDTMKCIKELEQEIPSLTGRSNQKISRLLKALVDTGKLDRETVKKTPYFFIKR